MYCSLICLLVSPIAAAYLQQFHGKPTSTVQCLQSVSAHNLLCRSLLSYALCIHDRMCRGPPCSLRSRINLPLLFVRPAFSFWNRNPSCWQILNAFNTEWIWVYVNVDVGIALASLSICANMRRKWKWNHRQFNRWKCSGPILSINSLLSFVVNHLAERIEYKQHERIVDDGAVILFSQTMLSVPRYVNECCSLSDTMSRQADCRQCVRACWWWISWSKQYLPYRYIGIGNLLMTMMQIFSISNKYVLINFNVWYEFPIR